MKPSSHQFCEVSVRKMTCQVDFHLSSSQMVSRRRINEFILKAASLARLVSCRRGSKMGAVIRWAGEGATVNVRPFVTITSVVFVSLKLPERSHKASVVLTVHWAHSKCYLPYYGPLHLIVRGVFPVVWAAINNVTIFQLLYIVKPSANELWGNFVMVLVYQAQSSIIN